MGVRTYRPMRLAPTLDPKLRNDLQGVDTWLRQLSTFQARIPSAPQGTPSSTFTGTSGDFLDFLYLPGRNAGQISHKRVVFDAKPVGADGSSASSFQRGIGLNAIGAQNNTVYLSIEDRSATSSASATREWAFPAFNQLTTGPTVGLHYFVDTSDNQVLTKKTLDNGNYYEIEDTVGGAGWLNAAHAKTLQFAWAGSFPSGGGSRSAPTTLTGIIPSLQIPALDVKDNGAGQRDRTHVWCMLKSDHTDTSPFEPGATVYGSSSGREMYSMFSTAQGTLAAPADGSLPVWHPVVTQSCTFITSSAIVTMASTTGIQIGMRMRETVTSYSLTENTFVKSVDSATQITMSQVWPASNLTRTIDFFGMSWSDTSTVLNLGTGILDHGTLGGLLDDDHTQYLLLAGRTGGQVIGSEAHTGGSNTGLVVEGPVMLGDGTTGVNFSAGRSLQIEFKPSVIPTNAIATMNGGFVNLTGAASGALVFLDIRTLSGPSFTSGSYNATGFNFLVSQVMAPSNVTVSTQTGGIFDSRGTATGTGLIQISQGLRAIVGGSLVNLGTAISGCGITSGSPNVTGNSFSILSVGQEVYSLSAGIPSGTTILSITDDSNLVMSKNATATNPNIQLFFQTYSTRFTGHEIAINNSKQSVTDMWGFRITTQGTSTRNVTSFTGIEIVAAPANSSACNVWSLFKHTLTLTLPVEIWLLDFTSTNNSRMAGKLSLGQTTTPSHILDLGAGTTTTAPIRFASGTNLTTPVSGAMEFDGTRLYVTNSTPTRKTVAYTDDSLPAVSSFSRTFLMMGA